MQDFLINTVDFLISSSGVGTISRNILKHKAILIIIGISISSLLLFPMTIYFDEQQRFELWIDEFTNIDQDDFNNLIDKNKSEKIHLLKNGCFDLFLNDFAFCSSGGDSGAQPCRYPYEYKNRRDMCFVALVSEEWDDKNCKILYNNYVKYEKQTTHVNIKSYDSFEERYCSQDLDFTKSKKYEYNKRGHDLDAGIFNLIVDYIISNP